MFFILSHSAESRFLLETLNLKQDYLHLGTFLSFYSQFDIFVDGTYSLIIFVNLTIIRNVVLPGENKINFVNEYDAHGLIFARSLMCINSDFTKT